MRTYEAMLIFLTSLEEADVEKTLDRIGAEISRFGGSVLGTEPMGRRTFARAMKKQDVGMYYKLGFLLPPDQIDALNARLKLIDDLFRVGISRIVVKTEAPVAEDEAAVDAPEADAPVAEADAPADEPEAVATDTAPPAGDAEPVVTAEEEDKDG